MSIITGAAAEPQTTLTAPTVGGDTDAWGTILNGISLQALLNYTLWLKARVPAADPSGVADGKVLVVAAGALVFGDASASAAWGGITGTLASQTDLQAALDLKANAAVTINAQTGTAYTLVLTDAGKLITLSDAAAITLTVPANATAAFAVGTVIALAQLGAGLVTVAGAVGVTINSLGASLAFAGQFATVTLTKTATDAWLLSGGLA